MYNLIAKQKNQYLHKMFSETNINPIEINNSVIKFTCHSSAPADQHLENPESLPVQQLTISLVPHQPRCFAPEIDITKSELAYGRWGMTKLIRELNHNEQIIRLKACATLNDELKDPAKCLPAVTNQFIVKRLCECIDKELKTDSYQEINLERILLNFVIISTHLIGAQAIINEILFLKKVFDLMIGSNDAIKYQSASLIQHLSTHFIVADKMIELGYLSDVMVVLKKNHIYELFDGLANLIERKPIEAVKIGYFEFLLTFISSQSNCQSIILKCFACLMQCEEAQSKCDNHDTILQLYKILCRNDEDEINNNNNNQNNTMIFEYAAMALHNSFLSTNSIWRARELWDLPIVLIRHAHSKINPRLQMHCLQTLRQITKMPIIKNFVRKVCKRQIISISCDTSPELYRYKNALLDWLRYRNYEILDNDIECQFNADNIYDQQDGGDICKNDELNKLNSNNLNDYLKNIYRVDKIN